MHFPMTVDSDRYCITITMESTESFSLQNSGKHLFEVVQPGAHSTHAHFLLMPVLW